MSRNRTNELQAASAASSDPAIAETAVELTPQATSPAAAEFLQEIDALKSGIDQIRAYIGNLEQCHASSLTNVSTDEANRNHQMIDALTNEINRGLQYVQVRLKTLDQVTKNMPKTPEYSMRKSQQSAVAKKLTEVARYYNEVQSKYKQKYRERMERQYRIVRPEATPEQIETALDQDMSQIFSQDILTSKVSDATSALQEAKVRHDDIQKIEQSIEELVQLFQDMSLLLDTQQEMVNTIEAQVENTAQYVEEGSKQVEQAIEYRKKSRRRWWWICGCVVVLVIVLALVLYFTIAKR
ncbi:t-SNARE [Hyaloraphidium curvatum]|nr:t-SNARE [Hyaloraphidium curvatum]